MSIITLAVAWEKWQAFSKIKVDSAPFLESIRRSPDANKIISFCEKSDQPLAFITQSIYKAPARREDKERVLQRSIQAVVQKLDSRIALLGTTASVAPFIGLLGTVIGIIKSFRAVSMSAAGG